MLPPSQELGSSLSSPTCPERTASTRLASSGPVPAPGWSRRSSCAGRTGKLLTRGLTVVREQQKKKAAVRQGDAETLAAGADPAEALEDAEAHTLATALQRLKETVKQDEGEDVEEPAAMAMDPAKPHVCGRCNKGFPK